MKMSFLLVGASLHTFVQHGFDIFRTLQDIVRTLAMASNQDTPNEDQESMVVCIYFEEQQHQQQLQYVCSVVSDHQW